MVDVLTREIVAATVPRRKGGPKWPGWASQRNDAADYARLAAVLGPRLHPVRPAGRPALHISGQIPLFPGTRTP
jgi:hypothetical protein